MKLAKKVLAVVLAVLFVASAFVGCSNGGADNSKKGESAEIIAREPITSDVQIPADFKIITYLSKFVWFIKDLTPSYNLL